MKRLKHILALAVAVVTALALSTAALADDAAGNAGNIGGATQAGSITIDNAVNDKTYSIYRMFDLDDHNSDYTAITYKVNSAWEGFFAVGAEGRNYVDIDDQGYVTWKEGAKAADLATAAIAYATANSISSVASQTATTGTVTFADLELGYYLVRSGLGAICSLDTTLPNVTIKEKNGEPTIDKQVEEKSTGAWGETNDANVGDTVNFQTTVNVVDGNPKDYVVHDTMSAGLTFSGTLTVKVNGVAKTVVTDYTLEANDNGFTLSFVNGVLKPNDVILIEYSATLNANAVVAGEGNPNTTYLSYTDTVGSSHNTESVETRTYTWPVDVLKYTLNGETETPLAGAEFILSRTNGGATQYAQVEEKTGATQVTYKITGWTSDEPSDATFTTPADGKFLVEGLDAGAYKLTETNPPAGYNKLKDPIAFTITASIATDGTHAGTATVTYNTSSTGTIKVENKTGSELPSTGGMGTTVLYVLGGILVVGAGVALVTRKRMGNK